MSNEEIKGLVFRVAAECSSKGPGWAQEGVVLREVAEHLSGNPDLKLQQSILDVWHDLFMEKRLAWGYDLDNPNSPFFHLR
jgi:hypothetical protein